MSRMRAVTKPILMHVSFELIRSFVGKRDTQGRGPGCPLLSSRRGVARERTQQEVGLASPAAPEARARPQVILDFPALLRGQDRGRVSERLHDTLAGRVGERQLLHAKRLDGGAVDR